MERNSILWIGKLNSIIMLISSKSIINITQFQSKFQQKFLWNLKADSKVYVEVQSDKNSH